MKLKGLVKFFSFFITCLVVQSGLCSAQADLSCTPQKISETCRKILSDLGAQFGKYNLKIYCPLSESQILMDSERLYKVVSKFLDDNKDVDPSKFDEFCRIDYIAGKHRNSSFDGKIKVVSADEFKKYLDNPDYVQLYRGVNTENSADLRAGNIAKNVRGAIRGDYYSADNGATSGNGMYFTTEYKYAKMWADNFSGDVITGVIDKKDLECIDGTYLGRLFDLMIKNHVNDREDFKEYDKNVGSTCSDSGDYMVGSSAFKQLAEIVKNKTGFDYYSDENQKLDAGKRWEEFKKAEEKMKKNDSEVFLEIAKGIYKNLYGTDNIKEMLSENLNSSEFKKQLQEKAKQDARTADLSNFREKAGKESYLLDKVHAMSRNSGLLAKLLGFDAVCETQSQSARGDFNPNRLNSDNFAGGVDDETLQFAMKMAKPGSELERSKLKENPADYYDFVGDEVVLVNFDNLVLCADKFELNKKTDDKPKLN